MLRNLIRNAVAHTGPGDRISILARARGERLEISVSETGPGIPPGQLEQILAESARGRGATLRIELPRYRAV